MKSKKLIIQKEIEKMWPQAKKNFAKINKDVSKIIKKSEKNLINTYANVKRNTEKLIFKAKREELYYELGKAVAATLSPHQLKKKNISRVYTELQKLNKKLGSKK